MITKEQEAALMRLCSDTYCLWNEKGANEITLPFGFRCRMSTYKADPRDPKGLTLNNGAQSATGASSWDISGQIATRYGLRPPGKLGRGFQVRADCQTIRDHLNKGE